MRKIVCSNLRVPQANIAQFIAASRENKYIILSIMIMQWHYTFNT